MFEENQKQHSSLNAWWGKKTFALFRWLTTDNAASNMAVVDNRGIQAEGNCFQPQFEKKKKNFDCGYVTIQ